MKQSLQLKLGQTLTMTPQLQQAIRLLQLSSLELSLEVQQALDSNMMLELVEEAETDVVDFTSELAVRGAEAVAGESAGEEGGGGDEGGSGDFDEAENFTPSTQDDIPQDMPVDSDWDDIYDSTLPAGSSSGSREDGNEFESMRSARESLHDQLTWQLNLLPLTPTDRAIAHAIVDGLNQDGYLTVTLDEILSAVSSVEEVEIELDEVQAVLKQVQSLDPPGVAARDLRECLILQLRQLSATTPWKAEALRVCEDYLDALGGRDYTQIMRRLKITQDDLRKILTLIQSMNPRPGAKYNEEPPEYLIPDVFVRKVKGRWKVELNPDTIPHVRVNPYYQSLIRRADNSADNSSLKTHLQEAKWFIKSLQSRSETLLRVATAIVEQQKAFLEYGEEAMKPLVLHDIAEALGMHESTISRVTTRKYMHTPRGIFELKYFFSSHVSTSVGGEASSTAIRAVIKKLIAAESSQKPLSDSKIATLLSKQGINVARRTIAKYREAMQIPPSNERKRLA
ncbi:MAG: RNA polymerase factor sigma-54 [Gammaproteobacteria bacterium]|nr:RNA polymerase factor sigma-54 [Gammaproteobacteria bacterium]